MDSPPVDFSAERLVRQAPDRVLLLDPSDSDYILDALAALRAAFPGQVPATLPLNALPARAVMRALIDLSRLRAASPEQSEAKGRLMGAIGVLQTACAFAAEHDKVRESRLDDPV
jgi:hypothetical protein